MCLCYTGSIMLAANFGQIFLCGELLQPNLIQCVLTGAGSPLSLVMVTSLDQDESRKNSRTREKISRQEISQPEICTRTGIEVSANETQCLCSLPAVDARHFTSRLPWPPCCWCLITPPAPPHSSSVAVCLSVHTV